MNEIKRCAWCSDEPIYQQYHDEEWGVPSYDPRHLFEKLLLEGFQAGLSWILVLKRRENFRRALYNFDAERLAEMPDSKIDELMQDASLIRNRAKFNAARDNAKAWLALDNPVEYLWSFVGGEPIKNRYKAIQEIPTQNELSLRMSKELKKKGFKFVGPTICYSYLQAVGMVNDHTIDCHCYAC
ncbi:DNA-3-methyladenine glycosylase I [Pseudomonas psychrotolerans]|uniref:DNA-3-methyladenine glycosylase I n=1 Tax=Pseudomonas oryzihabitans TaxID=47885 RepID=A0AAJ2EW59_9PSED|nr:DNA-3-methyladenine glycosylase I [Pseudomonas psychrotolerans]MDR6356457.1 DNA-3-methyladenine glycosylase I [Pseudomonas psychrotolerans]